MAFGIESRVPFADDVELVDYIFSIEGNKKIQTFQYPFTINRKGKY